MNDRSNRSSVTEPAAVALLDAVERVFTDESPSTLSMRAIASEAGCSVGLAYNYFTSKDELVGGSDLVLLASRHPSLRREHSITGARSHGAQVDRRDTPRPQCSARESRRPHPLGPIRDPALCR
jgi:hypothetical protein